MSMKSVTWRSSLLLSLLCNVFVVFFFGVMVVIRETKPELQPVFEVALVGGGGGGGSTNTYSAGAGSLTAAAAVPASAAAAAEIDALEPDVAIDALESIRSVDSTPDVVVETARSSRLKPLDVNTQNDVVATAATVGRIEDGPAVSQGAGGGTGSGMGTGSGSGSGSGTGSGTGSGSGAGIGPGTGEGNFSYGADGVYTALTATGINYRILYQVDPVYPAEARSIGYSKMIAVNTQFIVGLDGKVESVKILNAVPNLGFEAATRKALAQWRFSPIYYKQINIKCTFIKTFYFTPR